MLAALVASLRAELAWSQAALAQVAVELAQARERIAELEARLRQTPRNSSRPPSSEGLGEPPPRRSLRKKSGRKPGGQDGHEGSTLAQVTWPDRELRHEPGCCGRSLADRPVTGVERRQVFDLPEVTVTGHDTADPAALAAQARLFRSAAAAGASQTAARSGALMKKHNALARRLLDRQDDSCGSPGTGRSRPITTAANATSA
jgi:hypothetical protein